MAVLAVFTVRGKTDDLLQRYEALMRRLPGAVAQKPLSHIAVPFPDGMRIYDVWESPEILQDFAGSPTFRSLIAEVGLPEPEVEVLPVHRFNW